MNTKSDKTDETMTLQELKNIIKDFIQARDWDQFHNAKNSVMAIAVESAELMEHFIYLDNDEADELMKKQNDKISQEIADVFITLTSLCNRYELDLTQLILNKMAHNAKKYPVEKAKGRKEKYTDLN